MECKDGPPYRVLTVYGHCRCNEMQLPVAPRYCNFIRYDLPRLLGLPHSFNKIYVAHDIHDLLALDILGNRKELFKGTIGQYYHIMHIGYQYAVRHASKYSLHSLHLGFGKPEPHACFLHKGNNVTGNGIQLA